jgi:menaquinol-cytochrome c reductase iron-sulfur subunit
MDQADQHNQAGRRRFLGRISLAIAGLAALGAAIPFVAYFVRPARSGPPVWRDVGALEEFPLGETRKVVYPDPDPDPWGGLAVRNAAWVRREGAESFVAFSIYCTHTGCPVNWVSDARLFLCPCHGGIFDGQGEVTAGPPPRPLDRAPIRVRNGRVEIRTIAVPMHG